MARTALALGTLGTLLFTSPGALFAPALGVPPAPYCTSVGSISLFCVMPERYIEPAGPVRAVGAPRLLAFRTDRFAIDLEVTNRAW